MLTCTDCLNPMVPNSVWRKMTKDERATERAAGNVPGETTDLCSRCRATQVRRAKGAPVRNLLPRDVVEEEWNWLSDPWAPDAVNIENLAPRLGVNHRALEQAVKELRDAGRIQPERVAA